MGYKKLSQRTWNRKMTILLNNAFHVLECKKCGSPTIDGCCCTFCGDSNPDQTVEQEAQAGKE